MTSDNFAPRADPPGEDPPPGPPFPPLTQVSSHPPGAGAFATTTRQQYAQFLRPQQQPMINPFHTPSQLSDTHFYTQLHYPWNVAPDPTSTRIKDYKKLEAAAPRYSGDPAKFPAWRAMFIHNVHKTNAEPSWKATILMSCLDVNCPRLDDIVAGLDASPEAYARAITRLERAFGHPLGIKGQKKRELDLIHHVREHDFRMLEKFHYKLDDYVQLLGHLQRGHEALEDTFFEELFVKLDRRLARNFQTWHAFNFPQNAYSAYTLLAWLEEIVQQQQAADRAHLNRPRRQPQYDAQRPSRAHYTNERPPPEPEPDPVGQAPSEQQQAHLTQPATNTCPFDGQQHRIIHCPEFKAMSPPARRRQLRQRRRCYACFEEGHRVRECTRGIVCTLCNKNHHTLLHGSRQESTDKPATQRPPQTQQAYVASQEHDPDSASDSSGASQEVYCGQTTTSPRKISLQTLPVTCINPISGNDVSLNCMLDSGATGAFLSRRAAAQLGLTGRTCNTKITGFNGATSLQQIMISHIKITAPTAPVFHVTVQVTEDPAASYQPFNWNKVKHNFAHLAQLDLPAPVAGRPVDLMLGQDTPHLIRALEPDRFSTPDAPVARRTALGWTVGGPTGETTSAEDERAFHVLKARQAWFPLAIPNDPAMGGAPFSSYAFSQQEDHTTIHKRPPEPKERPEKALTDAVLRMFDIDDAAGRPAVSLRDEQLFQRLREHMTQPNLRYQLPVLWKEKPPKLSNNYATAYSRLRSLERSLQTKNKDYYNFYFAQIHDWLAASFVEQVPTTTPALDIAYYLPHFAVIRPDKVSSQIRTVMDAAVRCNGQPSLNDNVYKGPKLVNELVNVLLRFRRFKYTVAADIEKMFHKLQMPQEDRDFHRFLWRERSTDHVQIYRWRSHVFGNAGSPCVAIFAIKEHARKQRLTFPEAADTIIFSTLVDDAMDSRQTLQEAELLLTQLREMLALMDMQIKKVVTNSSALMETVPQEERSPSLSIANLCQKDETLPLVKALGVIYLPEEDAFTFTMSLPEATTSWTKRMMLRFQARLYDPHGLLLPHTILARMILQEVWRTGSDWDQQVHEELQMKWRSWLLHLPALPLLRIPRCLYDTSQDFTEKQQFHVFCDASADGYAAAAYTVTTFPDGTKDARLTLAKGRVAPLRQISIPRLELLAAELALEVAGALSDSLALSLNTVHFWSDSTNVLCWLRNDSRVLNSFVGTRVAKIQHHTCVAHWGWVPGNLNPADIPSRGLGAGELAATPLWWEGPPFLTGQTEAPTQPDVLATSETAIREVKKGAQFAFIHPTTPQPVTWTRRDGVDAGTDFPVQISRFSSWTKLVRVVAQCKRAFRPQPRGHLRPAEIREAERVIFTAVQAAAFAQTLAELQSTGQLPPRTQSALRQVQPRLHPDGLLRSHARLRFVQEMPYDQRHPIILPKNNSVTDLVIRHAHRLLLHAGTAITLTHLLNRFWIVQGRRQVRRIVSGCLSCRRRNPRPLQQVMAPVPDLRLPQGESPAPFDSVGIDMAGPFVISNDKRVTLQKRYFLLITCTVTRAVHLEPLASANTASFLTAYERFLARRRGQDHPAQAVCDNGSNLTSGARELAQLWKHNDQTTIRERYGNTNWTFTPPLASHYGGIYERLVGAVKTSLYHALPQESPFSDEEFHTALVEVEGILNSRPLSYVSGDPDTPRPLTPADALGVPPYRQLAPAPPAGWKLQRRWHFFQARLDAFWKRFAQEVIPYLQLAHKWTKTRRDLRKGDVVLILDDQCRGRWPLALVHAVEEGADGHVRAVLVRQPGIPKHLIRRRPISKLSLLLPTPDASMS